MKTSTVIAQASFRPPVLSLTFWEYQWSSGSPLDVPCFILVHYQMDIIHGLPGRFCPSKSVTFGWKPWRLAQKFQIPFNRAFVLRSQKTSGSSVGRLLLFRRIHSACYFAQEANHIWRSRTPMQKPCLFIVNGTFGSRVRKNPPNEVFSRFLVSQCHAGKRHNCFCSRLHVLMRLSASTSFWIPSSIQRCDEDLS